jgi:pSer/pThr/pTyr-binding forkhead associated (FHA) protein
MAHPPERETLPASLMHDDGTPAGPTTRATESGPTCVEIRIGGDHRIVDVAAEGDLVIGRAPDVGLTVDDARVSRRHLRIAARDGVLVAIDLGSKNGTLLNGRRLEGEQRLRAGDELAIGPLRLRAGGEK